MFLPSPWRASAPLAAAVLLAGCAIRSGAAGVSVTPEPTAAEGQAATPRRPAAKGREVEMVDVASLGPYFDDVFGGEAALALAEDRLEDAMRMFDDIARDVSDPVITPRARFISAFLAQRLGDDARALSELPGLAHRIPEVADTARETAALAALELEKYEQAIALAREVSRSSVFAENAVATAADATRALGRWSEAAALYREILEAWPDTGRGMEIRARLVECAVEGARAAPEGERAAPAEEGLSVLEAMRARAPRDRWTRIAIGREADLWGFLGKRPPARREESEAAQRAMERAEELKRKMRNDKAEKAFSRAAALARGGGELECRALLGRASVVARLRDHARAGGLYEAVAGDCSAPDVRVRALYFGGKAYQSGDRHEDAIRLFAVVESDFPDHSYADDARLRAARSHLALGDREAFTSMISALPDDYPDGDMRAEALWSAAWESISRGDLPAARDVLARYFDLFPVEEGWYSAGRSGYWLGRVEELLGDAESAAGRYEHVIASSPLAYYMVLAYNRLARADGERAERLTRKLAPPGGDLSARFEKALLDGVPDLATGIELLRLGLTTRARRVFDRLLSNPAATAEIHWVVAALFRRMGRYSEAGEVASGASAEWRRRYPSGEDLARWTLAYPTAYEDEVAAAAEESGVEPALLWAVMREESGFAPRVESWANAMGLMQLILPTARSMGERLGIRVTRKTLRNPAKNVRLGAAYLSYLAGEVGAHPAVIIAGYNAGEGAVGRWLADGPDRSVDEFVEDIPYQQTRGYTKRVLSSFATYLFLYGEDRPVLEIEMSVPGG